MISCALTLASSLSVTNAFGRSPQCGWDRDDGALEHGRVGDDRLLDLDRGDVLAGDDDVLAAVAELDVAVRVPDGEVAGVEPAARRPLGGGGSSK
jgi:hypothetical protein